MNKAFCKEPDSAPAPRCPACGNEGLPVRAETLLAHADPARAAGLGEPSYWCGSDRCTVAYFDLLERTIMVDAARELHWPKDPAGPLCACHGLTVDDVDRDIAEGAPTRVRAVVEKAGAPGAACAAITADGRSCVARVQRHYLRRRQELAG